MWHEKILLLLAAAHDAGGRRPTLYVFDNGVGRGALSIEEQTELTKKTGYAGIFYSGTKNIPELLAEHKSRSLKVLGIYTGMNLSDAKPGYDPGLPEAIRQLKGSGALITFTVNGKRQTATTSRFPSSARSPTWRHRPV